ncbi:MULTISPECIES: VWA domain-containing protein [unclassified Shinella]|uniref:vWA domain-containing protein n=2 Tax=Shinella TaxID=323620 RepID=UPI0009E795B3|nr:MULTISPECIES: VWA domain-containing protein [unclassified Shinella]TAA50226.1 VWA domain-containing protein [Shinella sp. JR1-6]
MRNIWLMGMAMMALAGVAHAEMPATIIVMDGSGSMWGQIDGRPKLEIARTTVADVLKTIPAGQQLGLLAYGHREKGNCGDIELMVPPASGTAAQISTAVNTMRFLGKTPLSDAVRQAAEALRYREEAATVVLVTDGLETCSADPCALADELETAGLNFTAHVIGFGLSQAEGARVACLAEGTGGRYFEAKDAASLAKALQDSVTAALPEASKGSRSYFPGASMMTDITLVPTGMTTGVTEVHPPEFSFPKDGTIAQCAALCEGEAMCSAWRYEPAGSNFVEAARCFGFGASSEMDYNADAHGSGWASGIKDGVLQLVRPYVPVEIPPEATLDAPATAPIGQAVAVAWTGPAVELDTIEIGLPGDGERWTWVYVANGNPASLLMPGEPGDYEIRYKFRDHTVIAKRQITVTEGAVSLTAPQQVLAGSEVAINWSGPDADYDNIQIAKTGSDSYVSYGYVRGKNPLVLAMPEQPGSYELRYKLSDSEVIATRPIEVLPADAVLPEVVQALRSVVIEAEGGGVGLNISWSAVPVPGQMLARDVWAMPEGVSGPVTAEFLPGLYDVTGNAGDHVFSGRMEVTPGGENHFVVPLSRQHSPTGEDQGALKPMDPVPLRIKGVYEGAFTQWAAFPLDGQDSLAIESGDPRPRAWETRLDRGHWLIRGRHDGATGATYLAVIEVATSTEVVIERPTYSAVSSLFCQGPALCLVHDRSSGLSIALSPGWRMEPPIRYETAAGVESARPSTVFMPLRAGAESVMVALNPRQWDAMLGPCEPTAVGLLCRPQLMAAEDLRVFRILSATLELAAK